MTTTTTPEDLETNEQDLETTPTEQPTSEEAPEEPQDDAQDAQDATESDDGTFPASYVKELRQEAADARVKARDAETERDAIAQRLHTALVTSTGRLADPTDLPFDPAHLEDDAALAAAVDELLERKPHLANRRPRGDIGQGATPSTADVDLAGILRARS